MEFPACPFCNVTVPSLEIERHANDHLDDEEYARDLEFAQQISLAPPFVDNSVEHINSSWDSPQEQFFKSVESEDVGWGCGWRNIQMLSSHLLKQRQEAREVLYGGSGFVPDIAALQRWLELAWERGFDTLGSNDFDQKIYGRRNWIGTTECAALFRSFALRARIVDFCGKDVSLGKTVGKRKVMQVYGPMDKFLLKGDSKIPGAVSSGDGSCKHSNIPFGNIEGHQVLIDWVWNYFSGNNSIQTGNQRVVLSGKPPLYFQRDGHSRTIIGIQVQHQINGMQHYNLLILDPASKTRALEKSLKENVGWQKLIKRGVHTLKKDQYQLCFIDPGIASGEELEKLKTLHSICVEF
ncbi:Peptidase C78 [Abeliophyllum distichum]|uniref:Peptidase C78 n=1 Tax=Abeliophyllum distichum TaxID=126358 RepID=A0ABD1VSH2_9LAMI